MLRNSRNTKLSDTLCTKFGISVEEFPEIVYEKKKGSIMFFLYSYLKKKPSNPAYRSLNRIEEIFVGLPEYLVMLCELLVKENRTNEAKGIFLRNGLTINDFKEILGDERLGE